MLQDYIPANELAAELLKLVNLDDADIVIGETYNPDYKSPSVSQWGLFHLKKSLPSFDINTSGISLSFISYFFDPQKFGKIVYFISNPINHKKLKSAGAIVEFCSHSGHFKISSVKLGKTTKRSNHLTISWHEGLKINSGLQNCNCEKNDIVHVENEKNLKIISDNFVNLGTLPQVSLLIELAKVEEKNFLVFETSCDGEYGLMEIEKC